MSYPYSTTVIKHFKHPKNVGKIKNADGTGRAGNVTCGDIMELYLKIKNNKIVDAKFQTFGCVVALANTSILTTMIKGKTLDEVLKISKDEIIKKLGEPLPQIKIHCSILALDALYEALYDYYTKNKLKIPEKVEKEHERIQKTLKNIEERHKEFLNVEKKLLEKG